MEVWEKEDGHLDNSVRARLIGRERGREGGREGGRERGEGEGGGKWKKGKKGGQGKRRKGKEEGERGREAEGKKKREKVQSLAWVVLQCRRASGILLGAQEGVHAAINDIVVFMQVRVVELKQMAIRYGTRVKYCTT